MPPPPRKNSSRSNPRPPQPHAGQKRKRFMTGRHSQPWGQKRGRSRSARRCRSGPDAAADFGKLEEFRSRPPQSMPIEEAVASNLYQFLRHAGAAKAFCLDDPKCAQQQGWLLSRADFDQACKATGGIRKLLEKYPARFHFRDWNWVEPADAPFTPHNRRRVLCSYFSHYGLCWNGANCPHSHVIPEAPKQQKKQRRKAEEAEPEEIDLATAEPISHKVTVVREEDYDEETEEEDESGTDQDVEFPTAKRVRRDSSAAGRGYQKPPSAHKKPAGPAGRPASKFHASGSSKFHKRGSVKVRRAQGKPQARR